MGFQHFRQITVSINVTDMDDRHLYMIYDMFKLKNWLDLGGTKYHSKIEEASYVALRGSTIWILMRKWFLLIRF